MSAQANILLADGQATPVNHAFEPQGAYKGSDSSVSSSWKDMTGSAVDIARATLRESHKSANSNGLIKVRHVIEVPTVATVVGVDKVVRIGTVVIETWVHETATDTETATLAAYAKNYAASAYFQAKVKTNAPTW